MYEAREMSHAFSAPLEYTLWARVKWGGKCVCVLRKFSFSCFIIANAEHRVHLLEINQAVGDRTQWSRWSHRSSPHSHFYMMYNMLYINLLSWKWDGKVENVEKRGYERNILYGKRVYTPVNVPLGLITFKTFLLSQHTKICHSTLPLAMEFFVKIHITLPRRKKSFSFCFNLPQK